MRTAILLFLVVAMGACAGPRAAGPMRAPLPADEGKKVHAVKINGVHAFSASKIADKLAMRGPTGTLNKDWVKFERLSGRLDGKRIAAYYAAHGYFEAKVATPAVIPLEGDMLDVIQTVEEGAPTRVTKIELTGAPSVPGVSHVSERHLRKVLGVSVGAIFAHDDYLIGRDLVQAELAENGWIRAEVKGDVAVDRDAKTAEIKIAIEPGLRYRFGTLTIAGTSTLPESSARARVPWQEGETFDPAALVKFQGRLLRMGLYGQVRLSYDPDPASPDVMNITATLTDGVKHDLRLGGGARVSGIASGDNGLAMRLDPHLRASYTLNRVFDSLSTLTLDFRPGYAVFVNEDGSDGFSGSLTATLGRQDIFFPHLHGSLTLAYDVDLLEAYQSTGPRVRVGFDEAFFDERFRVAVAWQLRDVSIDATNSDATLAAALNAPSPYRLGAYAQTIAWDGRDSPFEPHKGIYASVDLAEGGAFAGGAIDYFRVDAQARAYIAVGQRLVLAARARFGGLWPGDSNVQPITERFFAGGADMRGFTFRHLAPQGFDSNGNAYPIGGNGLVEGSLEARLHLWSLPIEVAAFVDVADVTPEVSDLSLSPDRLNWAIGPGLYVLTPIGPVGVDFGFRLNRLDAPNPDPGNWWAFNITLGEAF